MLTDHNYIYSFILYKKVLKVLNLKILNKIKYILNIHMTSDTGKLKSVTPKFSYDCNIANDQS